MENMRAGRLVELGRMACEHAPVRPPEAGEVLVRTQLAAICGSDVHAVFLGLKLAGVSNENGWPHGYPGHEGIGEVVESNDPSLKPGDRVLTVPGPPHMNCFCEFQTLPAAMCIQVPEEPPLEDLLMAQQLGTTIFALRQHPVDVVGRKVMVIGQGSAGMFFGYLLKRQGADTVIISDLSEARLAAGRRMSRADVAVKAERDNVREAVKDLTSGKGVDYLVEAVGSKETQLAAVDYLGLDGKLLYFGLPDTEQPIPLNFHDLFRKRITVNTTYGTQSEPGLVSFRMAIDLIVRKQIDVTGLVSDWYPIEQVDDAIHCAHDATGTTLKVGLTF